MPVHSLVIPFYQSASFAEKTLDRVFDWLGHQGEETEVLAVDDASPDETWAVLERYAAKHPALPLRLHRHPENRGKGEAIRTGFSAAKGEFLFFIDADLAYPIESLHGLASALRAGADIALGCRMHPESRYLVAPSSLCVLLQRHLMGRFFNRIVRAFVLPGAFDTQAGVKGFRAATTRELFLRSKLSGFSFDLELLFLASKLGLNIQEVGVFIHCGSEQTTVRLFEDSLRMLWDLLRIRWWDLRGAYRLPSSGQSPAPSSQV